MAQNSIRWLTPQLDILITIDVNGLPCLEHLTQRDYAEQTRPSPFFKTSALPLDSVRSVGEGNTAVKTAKSLIGSRVSSRLRYVSHSDHREDQRSSLNVVSRDDVVGVEITHHFIAYDSTPTLRSYATVTNISNRTVTITQLSSLTIGGLASGGRDWWNQYKLHTGSNTWFREAQWQEQTLSEAGLDELGLFALDDNHQATMATVGLSNRGSFSTQGHLPMGVLQRIDEKDTWIWQVEANGSWRWEIGDYRDNVYLSAGGPTMIDHDWNIKLDVGSSFTTVPVACCRVAGNLEDGFAALTDYRRLIMRDHDDNKAMSIIFNDYMNCLMGDPDEDKIKSLLGPVARSGAEYFVIDAGWYADDSNWWDDVGEWEPSKKRFPSGFKELLQSIKQAGLVPGVWVEPEVVGVRSDKAKQLPEEAFFHQHGERILERGRYQLDFTHSEVRASLHEIIGRLVTEYGVGYFKFDYNIEVVTGSDSTGTSTGAAHLAHNRAYLEWVSELLDNFPGLVIENCSSGAQRMDYAMLSQHTLQSTSDQQDPALYAAIAAAVPTAVVPEQSATWAYPQRDWSDEMNALTVVNSLLGRIHLSGKLDELSEHQYALIVEGMNVYKQIRQDLRLAHPFWPIGFSKWHDDWISLGMKCVSGSVLIAVWRRGGSTSCKLRIPGYKGREQSKVEVLYPVKFETSVAMTDDGIEVTLPATTCARLLRIGAHD